jgi:hypothetical protein
MALGADLHPYIRLGGTGVDRLAAGADDGAIFVNRMDLVSHVFSFL